MGKHPVPKQRSTHARSNRRYYTHVKKTLDKLAKFTKLVVCKACGAPRVSHMACPECGEYRGRKVILKKPTGGDAPKVVKA